MIAPPSHFQNDADDIDVSVAAHDESCGQVDLWAARGEHNASSSSEASNTSQHSDQPESNFFLIISGICVLLFISIFYAAATVEQNVGHISPVANAENVIPSFSDLSTDVQTSDKSENRNETDKENVPPLQAAPWYTGVVVRPVAFKAAARRPSQN